MTPPLSRSDEPLDVIDAIYSTRAVRRLRLDPIPHEDIWAVLDAAIRGPSSGNGQRWGWIVVTDQRDKQQIAEWYGEAWDDLSNGRRERVRRFLARIIAPLRGAPAPGEVDINLAAGHHLALSIANAPVWIIPTLEGVRGEPGFMDGADIFGAIQNLLLAARKLEIGGTITMLHRRREADVRQLLGLPDDVCTIALIPLGYPEGHGFSMPKRKPVETVTHWDRWGHFKPREYGGPDRFIRGSTSPDGQRRRGHGRQPRTAPASASASDTDRPST